MVAEALRHLGVIGGDNHDVIHAKLGDQLDQFSDDQREAIEKLQKAGDLLHNAPLYDVPARIGAQRLWGV